MMMRNHGTWVFFARFSSEKRIPNLISPVLFMTVSNACGLYELKIIISQGGPAELKGAAPEKSMDSNATLEAWSWPLEAAASRVNFGCEESPVYGLALGSSQRDRSDRCEWQRQKHGVGGPTGCWVLVSKGRVKTAGMEMNKNTSARCVFFDLDWLIEPYTDLVQAHGFHGNVGHSSSAFHHN